MDDMGNNQAFMQSSLDWEMILRVAGVYLTLLAFVYPLFLVNKDTRDHLIELIENKHWINLYRQLVEGLMQRLQTWFGDARSGQAFLLCLALAFIYPVLFFIWAYSWGNGSHEFAGIPFFELDSAYRIWYLPGVIVYIVLTVLFFSRAKQFDMTAKLMFYFGSEKNGVCRVIVLPVPCYQHCS